MNRHQQCGATAVELTVALLVVLLLGLGVFQFVMVYQARLAVEQAAMESARSGSTGNASDEAIRRGLARGLAPLLYGADDAAELQANEVRALARIITGEADGSIQLRRLAPTDAAFGDWEVPALDARGETIAGEMEIPNDNLDVRRTRSQPTSGVAGYRGSEPVGASSGVTLVDANLIRVELVYGVRLAVPIAGRLIAATLRTWHGCGGAGGGAADGAADGATNAGLLCPHLQADPPRLPLRAVATARMMSPARRASGGGGGGSGAGSNGGASADNGPAGAAVALGEGADPGAAPDGSPDGQAGRGGSAASGNRAGGGSGDRSARSIAESLGNGFLFIGSDREYPHPALCGEP